MKFYERLNFLLLGTLWTLAIVLVLDFWLNTAYNFNMFSAAHWQIVSALQAENQHIATGFYVAFVTAIILIILGLYLLFRPKFRKIKLAPVTKPIAPVQPVPEQKHESTTTQQQATEPHIETDKQKIEPTMTSNPMMQRPPRLHIQMPKNIERPVTATANTTTKTTPASKPVARYTDEIRQIFEKNKYHILEPKTISNVPLSLIALGANETLWVGSNDISHEQMADVMLTFKNVFNETLEDIEIDINAFIINPTDDDQVDAILDFQTVDELASAIENIPNESESGDEDEAGNMNAFAGYIETVLTYLGNK